MPRVCICVGETMECVFSVEAMVRGYHQYKDVWDAPVGEILQCEREVGLRRRFKNWTRKFWRINKNLPKFSPSKILSHINMLSLLCK